jgi:hypothetical protein
VASAVSLRIRHLRLRAETERGRFGADLRFPDGLVVLRADNSLGKSTAVKSILFGLGLERMVTARSTDVLTSAMRESLIYDVESKAETPVLGSWVSVEIEGRAGRKATLTRWVKDTEKEPGLIRVREGGGLSGGSSAPSTDYFVGRKGSVANPRGFHRWLAEFIGWTMPDLPSRDGQLAPLYMEQVFPLLFVEQRRGWGGIQAQMPAFSGVTDVRRRALEFLLDLDVGDLEAQRQQLRARESALDGRWSTEARAFRDAQGDRGLMTAGLPESLTTTWPPPDPPQVLQSVADAWLPIDQYLADLRAEAVNLDSVESGRPPAQDSEKELSELSEEADSLRRSEALLRDQLIRDRDELRAVEERIVALREDLRQHQDLVTLEGLGSDQLDAIHEDCPVCHQPLPTSLLGGSLQVRTLSPEDTVAYIRNQIDLFETMRDDGSRALDAKRERLSALRQRSADLRSQIRAIRTDLVSSENAPSADELVRKLRVQDRIDQLAGVDERFLELLAELDKLATEGKEVRAALARLPKDQLSPDDGEKISALETSFIEQLHEYEFGSFFDEALKISREDYRPRREDWDLQADISASDSIRVVWAYLLGLLEVSGLFETNHPGLLVFDEPRQQSTETVSFAALLRRAGSDSNAGQILFATSEELEPLSQMLKGVDHHLHSIDSYLLQPVSE